MPVDFLGLPVLGDVLEFLGAALKGWRYLLSSSHRSRGYARWNSTSQLQIAQEIARAIAGALFWLGIFCVIISFFVGFGWITTL